MVAHWRSDPGRGSSQRARATLSILASFWLGRVARHRGGAARSWFPAVFCPFLRPGFTCEWRCRRRSTHEHSTNPPSWPRILPRTIRDGRLVLCEEVARDGAQGKTLLLGPQRVDLFRRTADVMGEHADECLVMVGFPAIGPREVDCVKHCIEALDVGYQQVVCHTIERDLLECIALMKDAHAGRVLFVVPASVPLAAAMMHATPEEALEEAGVSRLGLERADGESRSTSASRTSAGPSRRPWLMQISSRGKGPR